MLNIDSRLIKEVSPKIGPNALSVLLAIAVHLNTKSNQCFPSNETLSKFTGIGRDGIYSALAKLKEAGLLKVIQQKDSETKVFKKRVLKVTTKFIGIFITADEAEPFTDEPDTGSPFTDNPAQKELLIKEGITKKENIAENGNEYSFEEFWNDYGFKKGSKAKALQKFKKLTQKDKHDIKDTLQLYKVDTNTVEIHGGDWKPMRKYPEFFLSGRIWENYIDKLHAQQKEDETFAPEWSAEYQKYLVWVKNEFPNLLQSAKYLSKQQYVRYKTEFYVEGKSWIDERTERSMLIEAHDKMERYDDIRNKTVDVFSYHCNLIKERLKLHQI